MGRQTKVCLELAKRKLNDFLFFSTEIEPRADIAVDFQQPLREFRVE